MAPPDPRARRPRPSAEARARRWLERLLARGERASGGARAAAPSRKREGAARC
jgi:hypothetical protein